MNNFTKGSNIVIRWSILYSDGKPFPLTEFAVGLCYSTALGIQNIDSSMVEVSGNTLIWTFEGRNQKTNGQYSLGLSLYLNGRQVAEVNKRNAFSLNAGRDKADSELVISSYCDAITVQESINRGFQAMEVAKEADRKSTEALDKANTAIAKVEGIEVATEAAVAAASSANSAATNASQQAAIAQQNNATFAENEAQRVSTFQTNEASRIETFASKEAERDAANAAALNAASKLSELEGKFNKDVLVERKVVSSRQITNEGLVKTAGATYGFYYYEATEDGMIKIDCTRINTYSGVGKIFIADSISGLEIDSVNEIKQSVAVDEHFVGVYEMHQGQVLGFSVRVNTTTDDICSFYKFNSISLTEMESVTESTKSLVPKLGEEIVGEDLVGYFMYTHGEISPTSVSGQHITSFQVKEGRRYIMTNTYASSSLPTANTRTAIAAFRNGVCCDVIARWNTEFEISADYVVPYGVDEIKMYSSKGVQSVREYLVEDAIKHLDRIDARDLPIPTDFNGDDICIFNRGVCIGDSLTAGYLNYTSTDEQTTPEAGGVRIDGISFPAKLAMLTGIQIDNKGDSGETSRSWYLAHNTEDYSGYQFAIIQLGVNDAMKGIDGVKGFSDASKQAFENIISMLKNASKGIKIFVANIMNAYSYDSDIIKQTSADIKAYFEHYADEDVIFLDMERYSHTFNGSQDSMAYNTGHLSGYGYLRLARDYKNYISWYIYTHKQEFRTAHFIGTIYNYNKET